MTCLFESDLDESDLDYLREGGHTKIAHFSHCSLKKRALSYPFFTISYNFDKI